MAGGLVRWQLASQVLRLSSEIALELQSEFGGHVVEVDMSAVAVGGAVVSGGGSVIGGGPPGVSGPGSAAQYAPLRLLEHVFQTSAFEKIRQHIVSRCLAKWRLNLTGPEQVLFRKAVLDQHFGPTLNAEFNQLDAQPREVAQILRGLLTYEVLLVVFKKRWRVEYGAHPKRENYSMAVPYLAKDVASERTEFAHPDIVLLLTVATYYQSGLTKKQVQTVFKKLSGIAASEADNIYAKWREELGGGGVVGNEVKKLLEEGVDEEDERLEQHDNHDSVGAPLGRDGVNLSDPELFTTAIYPNFRRHMGVIDFWLQRCVFPAQAKQFPSKLVATAWDLARSKEICSSWTSVGTGTG